MATPTNEPYHSAWVSETGLSDEAPDEVPAMRSKDGIGRRLQRRRGATLVVGSDGLIGKALMARLQEEGGFVAGTTQRADALDGSHLLLDLSHDVEGWRCPLEVDTAIICAGVAKVDVCLRDPKASFAVNVWGIVTLARSLASQGAFVVFLSSNLVYDGSIPFRGPNDPVCPTTEYGRQKAEAEKRLLELGDSVSVVRLTKVLGPNPPMFVSWINDLNNGSTIRPFSDMSLSPVPLPLVAEVLLQVGERRMAGIVQVSGERDITYYEAATYIARRTGARPGQVMPIESRESGRLFEAVPSFTTLDATRLRDELGLEPPNPWEVIDFSLGLR